MCALFGWLDYKHILPYNVLKKLTQALANAAEERGTDAAGISYIKEGKVTIYKRPRAAHLIRFNAPDDTKAIMGHTRMATQGDKKHNYNNHPFIGTAGETSYSFAHNGVIFDKDLRNKKLIPDTHIETDSYAACQLIETQGKLDFDSLKYMAETVEGNFVFTVLDQCNNLYIVKGSNPMCLIHFKDIGLYVYASTESIMKNALKKVGLHKFAYERVETDEGDILRIDKHGTIERAEF
ncbi:MAG: class II glutamine amidotransferase, partial [Ruminococcus sp.]|nr:class II glutamine amidotransferase [Ruminococcus sp.]